MGNNFLKDYIDWALSPETLAELEALSKELEEELKRKIPENVKIRRIPILFQKNQPKNNVDK